jgi:regulator of protease activity HflC (stomatin/prohibitin superfamily)
MKKYRKFAVIAFSMAGPAAGLYIGGNFGQQILGVALGFALVVATGLLMRFSWDQWLLTSIVAIAWMLFSLLPFPSNLAYTVASALVGFSVAAVALRPLYGGNLLVTGQALISLLLGEPVSTQVVQSPPTMLEPVKPEIVGPARLIVKPNAAAVLEMGSQQTKVVGPGTVVTRPYEYTKIIYNLRPQHSSKSYTKVLTQDLIATDVRVGVTYGIDVDWEAREGKRDLTPAELDAIQQFHVRATNWSEELDTVLESAVRTVLGNHDFEHATSANYRQFVENTIANRVFRTAREWGIRVYRTHLIAVQPDSHVTSARELRFIAHTNADTINRYEQARAEAWKLALSILGEAYADASDNGVPDVVIVRELLRRTMEQATSNAATKSMLPRELRHLFDEMNAGGSVIAQSSQNGHAGPASNSPVP